VSKDFERGIAPPFFCFLKRKNLLAIAGSFEEMRYNKNNNSICRTTLKSLHQGPVVRHPETFRVLENLGGGFVVKLSRKIKVMFNK